MKDSHPTSLSDIRKAVGDPFTMSESGIDNFLERFDAGEFEVPPLPSHLLPAPLTRTIVEGQSSEEQAQADSLEELALAARNGDEPLSQETIQQMIDAQDGQDQE